MMTSAKKTTEELFRGAISELLSDIVKDAHRPDRIPKVRWMRERKNIKVLARLANIELTDEQADSIVDF